ncbi:putative membrane protein [Orientia chuto str. Dubai]|uniref:Putative membrane protein n=1 Tax=Orientia chuto str. Dubai TaxID=1359168 RepID=A0A0F3MQ71_9RICK|nr:putative membrane protein [Orientia chuto str. Dubai]
MNYIVETYLLLISNIFFSNFIFSIESEYVFSAMRHFGNYQLYLALMFIIFSLFCVSNVNYFLGKFCYKIYSYYQTHDLIVRYNKLFIRFNEYWGLILLLTLVPILGKTIIFVAGFLRNSYAKNISAFIVIKTLYYLLVC